MQNRWERFEELLEEARNTRDYDVTLAINQMVDYLLSENGAQIREQLSVQLVDQVDQLGVDAISFARKNVGQVCQTSLLFLSSKQTQTGSVWHTRGCGWRKVAPVYVVS